MVAIKTNINLLAFYTDILVHWKRALIYFGEDNAL